MTVFIREYGNGKYYLHVDDPKSSTNVSKGVTKGGSISSSKRSWKKFNTPEEARDFATEKGFSVEGD